jgi:branched-chain amino acid transport system substrate-binding protein
MLIEAMKKANSADPAKYLPELAKLEYKGATGMIAFDEKGDRKNAEMTIFTMKDGKLAPIAIIKGGQTTSYDDFLKSAGGAAPAAAPAAEAKKDEPKAEAKKEEAKK